MSPRKKQSKKVKVDKKKSSNLDKYFLYAAVSLFVVFVLLSLFFTMYNWKTPDEIIILENPETITDKRVLNEDTITVKVIEDPNCNNCQVDIYLSQIKNNLIADLEIEKIDFESKEGKEILESTESKFLPVMLFSSNIAKREDWEVTLEQAFDRKFHNRTIYYEINQNYLPSKRVINEIELRGDSIKIGDDKDKITIYEISDYECPFCALSYGNENFLATYRNQDPNYEPASRKVIEEYVKEGKVNYAFINSPISSSKSKEAHIAAYCSYNQDKFLEYSTKLFEEQEVWMRRIDRKSTFIAFAKEEGLDDVEFSKCLDSEEAKLVIEKDLEIIKELGISNIPTFIINNFVISASEDYNIIKAVLESEVEE